MSIKVTVEFWNLDKKIEKYFKDRDSAEGWLVKIMSSTENALGYLSDGSFAIYTG